MPSEITLPDEFASTMQLLVAQAEKSIAPQPETGAEATGDADMYREVAKVADRLRGLERSFSQLSERNSSSSGDESELMTRLQRMEDQLAALCQTESVNHRLFNSLHEELKSYRDNFLRESLQKPFIRDLVMLFDDLTALHGQMQSAAPASGKKAAAIDQWCANLQNAVQTLLEVLHRMDVDPIGAYEHVAPGLHRVVSFEPAEHAEEDGRIVMRLKRGFVWRDQVLRPEEVVAKRFG
ncbi:MAG: nucleotide exchange factor GrpE [Chthoniobacterales bacterium]